MLLFAALILSGATAQIASPPVQRIAAQRQATAMVRILPAAPIRFSEIERTAPETLTYARIRSADGSSEPARLVEFH